jgi:ribosomal protein S20
MNIEISDSVIQDIVQKQVIGVNKAQYSEKSNLENAVKLAILEMTTAKVIELIKSNPDYVKKLNTAIEESIVEAFNSIAKRIARDLGESVVSAIESEFRSY